MPDPVFDQNDRVEPPVPGQSYTAEQVQRREAALRREAQTREQQLRRDAEAAIAAGAAGNRNTPPPITAEDFEANPLDATSRFVATQAVSRQEWNQMTSAVQENLIRSARFQASQGKKYWAKLLPNIELVIQGCDPISKLDPQLWETAYNTVLGQQMETINAEERAAEAERVRLSLEPPSSGNTPPPVPRVLTPAEMQVAEGLMLTSDQWRMGEERLKTGRFPVTMDNRPNRRQ